MKTLYYTVRELTGAGSNSSVPIKDKSGKTLLDTEEQNALWLENFNETLNLLTLIETYTSACFT